MQLRVTARNIDLPAHLKQDVVAKLSKVEQLLDRVVDVEVVLSEEHNPRIGEPIHCEVVLHAKRTILKAEGRGPDVLTAVDRAQAKLIRQVRERKERRIARRNRAARAVRASSAEAGPTG